jgi:hypothetical protein
MADVNMLSVNNNDTINNIDLYGLMSWCHQVIDKGQGKPYRSKRGGRNVMVVGKTEVERWQVQVETPKSGEDCCRVEATGSAQISYWWFKGRIGNWMINSKAHEELHVKIYVDVWHGNLRYVVSKRDTHGAFVTCNIAKCRQREIYIIRDIFRSYAEAQSYGVDCNELPWDTEACQAQIEYQNEYSKKMQELSNLMSTCYQ